MQLDRVAAVIRPRTYPESVELGFRMARAWWRPIAGAWAAVGLPALVVLAAVLRDRPGTAVLLIWWLKPVFDRVPLFVLSRGLFGDVPTTAQTLRAWVAWGRRDLPATLTWLRFDPLRSFRMPVRLLEGQRGAARKRRMRVMAREVRAEAILLTVTCVIFELCVFVGLVALLLTLHVPADVQGWFLDDSPAELPLVYRWVLASAWVLATALIEPFYVAGGFGLYVNRRTHLEAWDIEVVFRRMAARLASPVARATAAGLVVLAALLSVSPASAAGADAPPAPAPDPGEVIREILADPVFGGERTETYWRMRQPDPRQPVDWSLPLGSIRIAFAILVRAVVVVAVAGALVWGLVHLRRRRRRAEPGEAPDDPAATEVVGLDVRPVTLPADVGVRARELWDAGRRREAVRLLYRGALARLVSREGLAPGPGATEGDLLRLAAGVMPSPGLTYFGALTEAWLVSAYGHRDPDPATGPGLIRDWDAHFGAAG